MKAILLSLFLAAALILGWVFYRSHASKDQLNVEPNAAREIEKAKRR